MSLKRGAASTRFRERKCRRRGKASPQDSGFLVLYGCQEPFLGSRVWFLEEKLSTQDPRREISKLDILELLEEYRRGGQRLPQMFRFVESALPLGINKPPSCNPQEHSDLSCCVIPLTADRPSIFVPCLSSTGESQSDMTDSLSCRLLCLRCLLSERGGHGSFHLAVNGAEGLQP
jgi:hypothetical protein